MSPKGLKVKMLNPAVKSAGKAKKEHLKLGAAPIHLECKGSVAVRLAEEVE